MSKDDKDKIIIPSDLDDEEYKEFLDVNFEKCYECREYFNDEEINTHDCKLKPYRGLFL